MKYFVLIACLLLMGCCESQKSTRKPVAEKPVESISHFSLKTKTDSLKKERLEQEKQYIQDSILAKSMLKPMLNLGAKNLHKKYYEKKILKRNGNTYSIIKMGNLFTNKQKHLYIRRIVPPMIVYIDIYCVEKGRFKKVFSHDDWPMVFTGDTIRDVNGDGYKDFIYRIYASAGCCARDDNQVCLYNKYTRSFYEKIEFINPTFSPSEKVIRGVEYGHPGEVPLYKYRWKDTRVDTIEYIYPADTLKKKFYIVKDQEDLKDPNKRKLITAVPKEYLNIDGYTWFINY